MGLDDLPLLIIVTIDLGAVPPGLSVASVRDIVEGQHGQFTADLDELPLPDDHLLGAADASNQDMMIAVQTRRGCPMDCSYCSTATVEGRRLRKRSPEVVVEWMARRRRGGFKRFMFVDNTFNIPASYAGQLCRTLGKEKLDKALALGCGVIGLSAHLGNFMIIMPRLAADGLQRRAAVGPPRYWSVGIRCSRNHSDGIFRRDRVTCRQAARASPWSTSSSSDSRTGRSSPSSPAERRWRAIQSR